MTMGLHDCFEAKWRSRIFLCSSVFVFYCLISCLFRVCISPWWCVSTEGLVIRAVLVGSGGGPRLNRILR